MIFVISALFHIRISYRRQYLLLSAHPNTYSIIVKHPELPFLPTSDILMFQAFQADQKAKQEKEEEQRKKDQKSSKACIVM